MHPNLSVQFICLCSLIIASNGSPLVLTILIEENANTSTTPATPTKSPASTTTPVPIIVDNSEAYFPGKVVECGSTQMVREGEIYVFRSKNSDRFKRSPYWYAPHPPARFQQHGFRYPPRRPYPFYPHPQFVPQPRPITNLFTQNTKPKVCLITFKTTSNCDLAANFDHHEIGDSSCSNQYMLLGDEDREIQICGFAQFPGFYKSHGQELFIKHYKKAAAWGSEFQGIVTCIKRLSSETTPQIQPRDEELDEEDVGQHVEFETGYAGNSESFFPDVEIEVFPSATPSTTPPSTISSSSASSTQSSNTTVAPSTSTSTSSSTVTLTSTVTPSSTVTQTSTVTPISTTSTPSSTNTVLSSTTTASSTLTASATTPSSTTVSPTSTSSTQSPSRTTQSPLSSTASPANQLQNQVDDSEDDMTDIEADLSDSIFNLESPIAPSDLLERPGVDFEEDMTANEADLSETVFNMDIPPAANQISTSSTTEPNEDIADTSPDTGAAAQGGGHKQYGDTDAAAYAQDEQGTL